MRTLVTVSQVVGVLAFSWLCMLAGPFGDLGLLYMYRKLETALTV